MPVTSEGSACPIMREPMSLDEFFALDVVLAELVDGQPVFLSSPAVRHQHLLSRSRSPSRHAARHRS